MSGPRGKLLFLYQGVLMINLIALVCMTYTFLHLMYTHSGLNVFLVFNKYIYCLVKKEGVIRRQEVNILILVDDMNTHFFKWFFLGYHLYFYLKKRPLRWCSKLVYKCQRTGCKWLSKLCKSRHILTRYKKLDLPNKVFDSDYVKQSCYVCEIFHWTEYYIKLMFQLNAKK